jgi:flagellar motor switch protein FliN/FliY
MIDESAPQEPARSSGSASPNTGPLVVPSDETIISTTSTMPDGTGRRPGGAATASPTPPHTFELLLDLRISVSVEVGRVEMPVRQVMELSPGAVIELERSATEPVEIYANGRCIGRGEVVVVGEQFGVRVTELGSSAI